MNILRQSDYEPDTVYPPGTLRIQDARQIDGGWDVEILKELDPADLLPNCIGLLQKAEPREKALGMKMALEAGAVMPPIDAYECIDGKLYISNGHHRWLAHKSLGRRRRVRVRIRVWVSPNKDGRGLHYEEHTGEAWAENPRGRLATGSYWRVLNGRHAVSPVEIEDV